MRTKLRRASDGAVIDRTFRAGEKFRAVRTEARKMQFLYADGADAHFMDTESFEQIAVPEATLAEAAALDQAEQRGRRAVHRRSARRHPAAERRRAEVTETDPGCAATPPPAAARSRRRSRPARRSRCRCSSRSATEIRVDTRSGDIRLRAEASSTNAPLRSAPGRGRSRSTSTISPGGRWARRSARTRRCFARALAARRGGRARGARRGRSTATPTAGRCSASSRWSAASCAWR